MVKTFIFMTWKLISSIKWSKLTNCIKWVKFDTIRNFWIFEKKVDIDHLKNLLMFQSFVKKIVGFITLIKSVCFNHVIKFLSLNHLKKFVCSNFYEIFETHEFFKRSKLTKHQFNKYPKLTNKSILMSFYKWLKLHKITISQKEFFQMVETHEYFQNIRNS